MIPLNRPFKHIDIIGGRPNILEKRFPNYNISLLYSSRDGLNYIYRQLYQQKGAQRVAVSPLTCFEAVYPIVINGHTPVFVDIDPITLNINSNELISRADVQAAQIIYLGGNPVELTSICSWAHRNNITLIEDCAQALGSCYNNVPLGTFGDYSVFSLVKNVYSRAGGLLLSNKHIALEDTIEVSQIILLYKKIKTYLESRTSYSNNVCGMLYNFLMKYRESEEHIPTSEVKILPSKYYHELLSHISITEIIEEQRLICASKILSGIDSTKYSFQEELPNCKSNRNRILLVSKNRTACEIICDLRKRGIAANNLTQSYLHSFQEHISTNRLLAKYYIDKLSIYEEVLPYLICIPTSPSLSDKEIQYIISIVNQLN